MSEDFGLVPERRERISRALRSLPGDYIRTIAGRLALRALPLLSRLTAQSSSSADRQFIVGFLLCAGSAWAAQIDTGQTLEIGGRAAERLSDLERQISDKLASDAGGAGYWVTQVNAPDQVDPIFRAGEYFARALAYRRKRSVEEQMFASYIEVERDIELAAGGDQLSERPLWNSGAPQWASRGWAQMKRELLRRKEHWQVWTHWYDARLAGWPFQEAEEMLRLVISDEMAREPAEFINARIAGLLGYEPEDAFDPDLLDPRDTDPVPVPGPYAVRWENGRLEARPSIGVPTETNFAGDMLDGLRELAVRLRAALSDNLADSGLEQSVDALVRDLPSEANQVRIGRLQIDLRTMQSLAETYAQSDRESEVTLSGLLRATAESLADFMAQFPAVREMEAGRVALHVVAQEDIGGVLGPVSEIASIAQGSTAVGHSVLFALEEGDDEIAALSLRIDDLRSSPAARAGAIEARSRIVGQKLLTVWNLGAEVIRGSGIAGVARAAGQGVRDGVQKGVERAVSSAINTGAAALALHLGHPMLALSMIVQSFAPLAKKAAEAGKEAEPAESADD